MPNQERGSVSEEIKTLIEFWSTPRRPGSPSPFAIVASTCHSGISTIEEFVAGEFLHNILKEMREDPSNCGQFSSGVQDLQEALGILEKDRTAKELIQSGIDELWEIHHQKAGCPKPLEAHRAAS